ncbi:uncharacterized protein LOC134717812 [Mytilus trossulus]|uniref:uncharacterized protein LOC134717812 n=1 Tax=Mytilus trossulus TaxID=6551 RepID=UPI003007B0B1
MDDILLSGYTLKFKNRRKISRVKSGGIVIGYRENLNNSIEVIETNSKFVLWCKISKFLNNEDIIFGVVYIPPEYTSYSSPDAFNEIESEYLELSTTFEHIFIIGDFNARTSNEKDYVFIDDKDISIDLECVSINDVCNLELYNIPRDRIIMDKGKTRYGNDLLDLCKCNNLFIMNGRLGNDKTVKFTCRNASVVDYCLSNVNILEKLIDFDVLEFSHLYSDVHCPLYLRLESNSLVTDCNEQDSPNVQSREKINKWDHKMVPEFRANINVDRLDRLLRNLKSVNLEKVDDNNVNAFVNEIGLVVLESAKTTFGTRTDKPKKRAPKKKGDKPWFNYDCKFARQNFRKLKRRLKFSPSLLLYNEVKDSERKYKKVMDKAIKTHRRDMAKRLKNLRSQNSKEYWNILNKREHTKQPEINFDNLLNFFRDLNSGTPDPIDLPNVDQDAVDDLNGTLNGPITKNEIMNCIKKLKSNKACGDDMIINDYIKSFSDFLIDVYVELFNLVFRTGIIPESWVIGTIKTFYKNKGNKFDPKNYRPITIVSCVGKLFTSILCYR